MKKKWEYLIADLVSLGLLEYGLFVALAWYWSKFQWSPLGYETCGMEFLGVLMITYPAFIIGLLIRLGLLLRTFISFERKKSSEAKFADKLRNPHRNLLIVKHLQIKPLAIFFLYPLQLQVLAAFAGQARD
ncbi:MAG: hypothetical protein IKA22_01540 [Lentisphaeria bacterium]|nr:hypothetical protein [Lentisphaeria bacterium]MBR2625622.1 hypothetical protein [Lentisphaeria bacterium]